MRAARSERTRRAAHAQSRMNNRAPISAPCLYHARCASNVLRRVVVSLLLQVSLRYQRATSTSAVL